ncbi:MAG: alginate lyase family protein, partial [Verrucomicrobiota bacterium]
PSNSGDSLVAGYAAGTSDINTAGAFVRVSIGGGQIAFNATDGTTLTSSDVVTYPRDTRLTFSFALNDSATNQPFNGSNLPSKTLEVWCYNWSNGDVFHALTVDVSTSVREPVCVGFRTWSASTNVLAYVDNVKLLDGPVIVRADVVPAGPPIIAIIPPRPFVHPSVFNSQFELERLKYRVNHQPGSTAAAGWNQLRSSAYASLNYQAVPYSNVVVMGSGTTPSESQFRQDAQAARAAALQWVITGDTRYRDHAVAIMNAWSDAFVTMSPASGTSTAQIQLEAAWVAPIWVSAADVIRYYNGAAAGWSAADIAKFDGMLNYLYGEAAKSATRDNNWGASAALTMIAVGAYQENRSRFDAGVQTWRNRLVGINAAVTNNGYIIEVCRDTTHPQYTLQVWMQAAEIAWKQGIDLYGTTISGGTTPQLAVNLENFANLFLGLALPPCSDSFLASYDYAGEQRRSGAYDIAFNHYLRRAGSTNLPHYSDLVLNHWRPGGWDEHFCSWSTFTHGDLSSGIPAVTNLVVWDSASNAVVQVLKDGDTLNLRHLSATQSVRAETDGAVSAVQFYTNGAALGGALTNAPFALASQLVPGNWFLSAVPSQNLTGGSLPGDPFTRFLRVVDVPAPWTASDLGTPAIPAWAKEDAGALTLAAAGTSVAGSAEQGGLLSAPIAGDVQITAQLISQSGGGADARAGLALRDSASAGARGVCVVCSPSGGAADVVVRTQAQSSASVSTRILAQGSAWLRLVRFGDSISIYASSNAVSWTLLDSATVPMNSQVQAGLLVFSGTADMPVQAVFENVLIEPLHGSYAEWQDWMFRWRGLTNAAETASGMNPDGDRYSNLGEFCLGLDPLTPDVLPAVVAKGMDNGGSTFRVQFTERKNAADYGRRFWCSADLREWSEVMPISMVELEDLGSRVVREVAFPALPTGAYYRAAYAP